MSRKLLWGTAAAAALLVLGFVGGVVALGALEPAYARRSPQAVAAKLVAQEPTAHVDATPAAATDPVHMAVRLDRTAVLRGGDGEVYAELELAADQVPGANKRAPTDFVVVIDRSGSMEGEKLAFAKAAATSLIERLAPEDRFALISYDGDAQHEVRLSQASPGEHARFTAAIRALTVGGSTNLSSGLDLAHEALRSAPGEGRARRVLLLSDGLANQGDTTPAGLSRRAQRIVQDGAVLSTMGIGDGFDEALMTALSEAGSGNFYYLARLDALPEFFQTELHAASTMVARNLTVELIPGADVQLREASGYAITRDKGVFRFAPGSLSAGQKRSIWLTLAVPTTGAAASFDFGSVRVTYQREGATLALASAITPRVSCVADEAAFQAGIVRDVWERAVRSEAYGRYQRGLADLVQSGTPADVDRATTLYRAKNRALAERLGSAVVLETVSQAERAAEEAKRQQQSSAGEREISAKRGRARSGFVRKADSYLSDPERGLF